ncbi:MAG TPA: hypothetical protein VJQ83_04205, partial [Tepidiformaceae bacterium]|nr:hypothetical protein [Tepidiformaceae bacterium]
MNTPPQEAPALVRAVETTEPVEPEVIAKWIEAGCFDADRMSVRRIMSAHVRALTRRVASGEALLLENLRMIERIADRNSIAPQGALNNIRDLVGRVIVDYEAALSAAPTSAQAASAGEPVAKVSIPTADVELHKRAWAFADEDTITYALHAFNETPRHGKLSARRAGERESMRKALCVAYIRNAAPAPVAGEPVGYISADTLSLLADPNFGERNIETSFWKKPTDRYTIPVYTATTDVAAYREVTLEDAERLVKQYTHQRTQWESSVIAMMEAMKDVHAVIRTDVPGERKEGEKVSKWQSIDSAPKDGTLFLAFCPDMPAFYDGFWSFRPKGPPGIAVCNWDDYRDPQCGQLEPTGFVLSHIARDSGGSVYVLKPSHWMPLPEPPK